MKNHALILKWATDYLISKNCLLQQSPEIVQETPWSTVVKFSTSDGNLYLKQTPPSISMEPKIIQLLANQLHTSVPVVMATNDDLNCFLMKDAGSTLRQYLKANFQPNLLYDAIRQCAEVQRSAENHSASFFALDVPDWRLNKLSKCYDQLINQVAFLKEEGMTDEELELLHDLRQKVLEQCELLSRYNISETLVQPDCNTNNMLFDPILNKMTLIDLGEIAISHPFFSLHNFLLQATIHHGVKEQDEIYQRIQEACFENWLALATKNQLLEAFTLSRKLWPIYSALAYHRLMMSVDQDALKYFYANKPNRLANHFREYIATA